MNLPVEKNEQYIVEIIDNGCDGEGITKINNFTVFVPNTIKGEKVKIQIVKVTTSHAFGKMIELIEKSDIRKEVDCETYKRCGGCNLRHIRYEETLKLKRNIVQNLINKTLETKIEVEPTIGMEEPYYYRNKAQYPIGKDSVGQAITGIYANRSHEIIPIQECKIQSIESQEIIKFIIEYLRKNGIPAYDEKTKQGILRHVVIKVGKNTQEIMCILVVNKKEFKQEQKLVEEIVKRFPKIKTIIKNINSKNTNVILGDTNIILYGKGYIYDRLEEYTFKISPMSFYQINPIQTEKLYNYSKNMANLSKEDIVLDLYCGIGTISIFVSKYVKKVYGIEIVEQAIQDAKENCKINNITNAEFMVGDVEDKLPIFLKEKNIKATVIFVDPPRRGLDTNTIMNLLKINAKKIVYISCNPATLIRDIKLLQGKYELKQIQPIDMFPFTSHVECVSVLNLKKTV